MRRLELTWCGALACVAAALAACAGPPPPPDGTAFSPKCPEHLENWAAADSGEHGVEVIQTIGTIAASGSLAEDPEVNDCQRLVAATQERGMAYGPLGVLFASQSLHTLFNRSDAERSAPVRAAATINTWPGIYPPLHLPSGWSCLYIVRQPRMRGAHRELLRIPPEDTVARARVLAKTLLEFGAANAVDTALIRSDLATVWAGQDPPEPEYVYAAYVVPVDATTAGVVDCPLATTAELGKFPLLAVHATPIASLLGAAGLAELGGTSIARWDGDFGHGGQAQHIAIRCGDAWCDVMPEKAAGPVPDLRPGGMPAGARADLKGWYDQQFLAVADPAGGGRLVPGPVLATYVPARDLGGLGNPEFAEWRVVGYIHLAGPSGQYKEKLNLDEGWNMISLRRGELRDDERPFRQCRGVDQNSTDDQKNKADPWWGKVESAGGQVAYFCGYQHSHAPTGDPLPGIVRWRWLEDDEGTWQRCAQGCCPIS